MPSQFERGVYEPGEGVRVFDGSEEDEDTEGSRLPLLIVLALMVLAMFAGLVWLAYTQGVARGRTETPVLAAATGPERVAPANGGGANVAYQGFKIYEQPAPADDDSGPAPAAAPKVAAAPAPVTAPPVAQTPAVTPPAATPPAAETPAPAKPAPVMAQPAAVVAKPVPIKPVANKPVIAKPVPTRIAERAPPAPVPVTKPATAAPTPLIASPAAKPAQAGGSTVLQIGAYKSQADADAAWKAYKARHAALLSGYGPDVQQADLGEKGTWYRLRITGFPTRDGASAVCDRLKADGASCFLGR